jgi:hypothetical protein
MHQEMRVAQSRPPLIWNALLWRIESQGTAVPTDRYELKSHSLQTHILEQDSTSLLQPSFCWMPLLSRIHCLTLLQAYEASLMKSNAAAASDTSCY